MDKTDIAIDSFQAILFDFDGVLAECMNVKTEAFAQLYNQYGPDVVGKVVKHHIENGGISRYVKIKHYHEKYLGKVINEEQVDEIAQKFSDLVVEKVIESEWVAGAKEFLEKYYKKIDLFVISGTPENELKKIVNKRGMDKYFKGVYGSPVRKPEHAKNIIKKYSYGSKKILYIGDSLSDYTDSQTAQIPFLGRIIPGEKSYFPDEIPAISDFFDLLK